MANVTKTEKDAVLFKRNSIKVQQIQGEREKDQAVLEELSL